MSRKALCLAFSALLFALCVPAQAQQLGKIFRIGYLDPSTAAGSAVLCDAFRQEMSRLGWIEGKTITLGYRFAEQKQERLPELAAELVRLKVDLIVVPRGTAGVGGEESDHYHPHRDDHCQRSCGSRSGCSLARPGGNVTGFSSLEKKLNTKRLEILKDAVPKLAGVALLRSPEQGRSVQLNVLRPAALALKLKMEEIETQFDAKGLEIAFQTAKQKQMGAIMTFATRSFFAERKRIVELAVKYRLPAIYFTREFVDEGGLMSYGPDGIDLFRRAAVYVDKILKGAKPADLPVQQATKFEFVINLKAAKWIELTIPNRVLERANQVIK